MATKKSVIFKIIVDIFCVLVVFVPWILLRHDVLHPFKRGFFCNDESLRYPFHDSTVPVEILIAVGTCLNIIVILVNEYIQKFVYKEHIERCKPLIINYDYSEKRIHTYLVHCYKTIVVFLFGAGLTESVTDFIKLSLGRLRPHFFAVCQPDWSRVQCTDEEGYYRYVTEDVCTGSDMILNFEARMSFPSGHCSFAMYYAVFLAMYLQARFMWKGAELLTYLCQVIVLCMGIFVCNSRVFDYWHHWSDALGGALLGFVIAYSLVRFACEFYNQPKFTSVCEDVGLLRQNPATYGTFNQHDSKDHRAVQSSLDKHSAVNEIAENTHDEKDYILH